MQLCLVDMCLHIQELGHAGLVAHEESKLELFVGDGKGGVDTLSIMYATVKVLLYETSCSEESILDPGGVSVD